MLFSDYLMPLCCHADVPLRFLSHDSQMLPSVFFYYYYYYICFFFFLVVENRDYVFEIKLICYKSMKQKLYYTHHHVPNRL